MLAKMEITLRARLVVQRHRLGNRVAVRFLTDPGYPVDECLVPGAYSAESTWVSSPVTITGEAEYLCELVPRVFVSEETCRDDGGLDSRDKRPLAKAKRSQLFCAAQENSKPGFLKRKLREIKLDKLIRIRSRKRRRRFYRGFKRVER